MSDVSITSELCQVCLVAKKELRKPSKTLLNFYDELCADQEVTDTKLCVVCEHLLRKFYIFKRKCQIALEILMTQRALDSKDRLSPDLLCRLLPPTSLGYTSNNRSGVIFLKELEINGFIKSNEFNKTEVIDSELKAYLRQQKIYNEIEDEEFQQLKSIVNNHLIREANIKQETNEAQTLYKASGSSEDVIKTENSEEYDNFETVLITDYDCMIMDDLSENISNTTSKNEPHLEIKTEVETKATRTTIKSEDNKPEKGTKITNKRVDQIDEINRLHSSFIDEPYMETNELRNSYDQKFFSSHLCPTPLKLYRCDKCEYATTYRRNIIYHLRLHEEIYESNGNNNETYEISFDIKTEPEDITTENPPQNLYKCKLCHYITPTHLFLKQHIVKHHSRRSQRPM